jgi:hypothetical protein
MELKSYVSEVVSASIIREFYTDAASLTALFNVLAFLMSRGSSDVRVWYPDCSNAVSFCCQVLIDTD